MKTPDSSERSGQNVENVMLPRENSNNKLMEKMSANYNRQILQSAQIAAQPGIKRAISLELRNQLTVHARQNQQHQQHQIGNPHAQQRVIPNQSGNLNRSLRINCKEDILLLLLLC